MIIGLRAGHSDNCTGAIGIVDEHEQMKQYYSAVKSVFEEYGHNIVDCNSNASTQGGELLEGATKANNANCDLFISLHMNCYNGSAHGSETLVSSESSGAYQLGNNFAELGFTNRGVKCESLYEMNHISAPNIISEICFCDSEDDINIYNQYSWEKLAHVLCNAIDSNIPKDVDSSNITTTGEWVKGTGVNSDKWWYKHSDGSYTKADWEEVNGEWYYFDCKGWMCTGWIVVKGKNYLLFSNGVMAHNCELYGYSFDSNGVATKIS